MSTIPFKYTNRRIGGVPSGYHVPVSGDIPLGGLNPLRLSSDVILHTWFHPSVQWAVGATSAPPEAAWSEAYVLVTAWWTDLADPTFYHADDNYPGTLIVGHLTPTLVASPSAPNEYYVNWVGPPEGFSAATSRKVPTYGVSDPIVNFGLTIYDPLSGFQHGLYSGQSVTVWALEETLWGSLNPM